MSKDNKNQSVIPYDEKRTKLATYDKEPFSLFNSGIYSLFDDVFDSFWSDPFLMTKRNWRPIGLVQDDKSYTIEVELPRFKREEVKLEIVNGAIQLTAQNDKSNYTKSWSLPNVNLEKVASKLENGVLTITIEKTLETQPKVIEIQ